MAVNLSLFAGAGWQFFDNNGVPLSGGLLYTYAAGTTTPLTTYTSNTGTVNNTNPIVLNGSGRIANEIWLTEGNSYKFILTDSNNVLIGTYDNIFGANDNTALNTFETNLANTANVTLGDNLVGFRQSNASGNLSGAVGRTVHQKFQESVSVLDFGADSTGTTDSSTAISNAIATGKAVYFPKGTYLCNVTINTQIVLYGDSSDASIIKPYSYSSAAINYNAHFTYSYAGVIRNLGFYGTGSGVAATGVGVQFGNGSAGSEIAGNVTFYNCRFVQLQKGVYFPYGNLANQFYACGFSQNYYAVYGVSQVSPIMSVGTKYFYNLQMDSNVCAFYFAGELGGSIVIRDSIIEYNSIGFYFYNNYLDAFQGQITVDNCWIEGNGQSKTPATPTITATIDNPIGGTQVIPVHTYYFDGTFGQYSIKNSWLVDFSVLGTNITVVSENSHTEKDPYNGGGSILVTSPTSNVILKNPSTNYGIPFAKNVKVFDYVNLGVPNVSSGATGGKGRAWVTKARGSTISNYGISKQAGEPYTSSVTTTGTAALVGAVVSDGLIFATCNQYTTTSSSLPLGGTVWASTTSFTMNNGYWYVVTFDVKQISGAITFQVYNGGFGVVAYPITCPTLNDWYSVACMVYCDSGGPYTSCTLNQVSTGVDSQWNLSAYQVNNFNSLSDAQAFLDNGVYTM